ncbi:UDP-N-acetylglucosamine--LPS N-acetylglucosamine transferase [Acuticoccus sediminis]|uniref:UDP-N-acetylglucosamine--LPS N-acetylglucosamine transferase n=1 Tax=Acuticoccus sediminis TaxID=2184697 RepID=A0A8B2NLW5_9HYPH|nr:UDP-N-acetylglucosamine--LPS N-acetylglucosamine transferase [Acuticoccus sediminis]RAH98804.1 UDP-N-acetylglucosamine--LPS N-acetylglucosamine transferase [Acuticoccus sediminis]
MANTRKKVLAVASGGGHWVQLLRLRQSWSQCAVTYVTTTPDFKSEMLEDARLRGEPEPDYIVVPEANRWQKLRLMKLLGQIAMIVLTKRPDVVISTGAAPGYFALRFARLLGAKTIWIDSIANADELSLSGQRIGPHADVWLTQWEDLSTPGGPRFWGAVI